MSPFTSEPWSIAHQTPDGLYTIIADAKGDTVALIPTTRPLAEARLVASCPGLFKGVTRAAEALQSVIRLLDRYMPSGWRREWAFEGLRRDFLELAAEARGEGRSHSVMSDSHA